MQGDDPVVLEESIAAGEVSMRNVFRFIGLLALCATALLACGETTSSTHTVDAKGGVFTFPNGVVLDIPPGAVSEPVEIEVTDVNCADAQPILSSAVFQSHAKGCLGGFEAKPDGLVFAEAVTATVPVRELDPAEIPLQVKYDFVNEGLHILPTDLSYDDEKGVVEIRNVRHFSETNLASIYQMVEDLCRTCEAWDTYVAPGPILVSHLCETYATDIWKGQQGGCCLLLRRERRICEPSCDCCMEKLIDVESSGVDLTYGECQVLGADVKVAYPACPDPTPRTHTATDMTPDCPSDMTLDIRMDPTELEMYACDTMNLREREEVAVTLSGMSGGKRVFGPVTMFPRWTPEDEEVATVGADDVLTAHQAGQITLEASLSRDPKMPTAEASLEVLSNIESFTVEPETMTLAPDQIEGVESEIVLAPGRPPADWPPIDPDEVTWSTEDEDVADVVETEGQDSAVRGVGPGTTEVEAELTYQCEKLAATVDVTVEAGIAGTWTLTPTTQHEECRYTGQEWWEEDPFSSFDIHVTWPGGEGTTYIESTFGGGGGPTLTGFWDDVTGDFQLSVDSSNTGQCGYLFYESDICGDALGCELVSCQNTTEIAGVTSESVESLSADVVWYYQVTFSFLPMGQNTWECAGSAHLEGEHQ